jgi:hypothetical protein
MILMNHMCGNGIPSGRQLPQSGIGIPASGFSPVPLVTDNSGIAQLCLRGISTNWFKTSYVSS